MNFHQHIFFNFWQIHLAFFFVHETSLTALLKAYDCSVAGYLYIRQGRQRTKYDSIRKTYLLLNCMLANSKKICRRHFLSI